MPAPERLRKTLAGLPGAAGVYVFLDADGEPGGKLFVFDGLHLSPEGYALWTSRIRPLLMAEMPAD